MSIYSPSVMFPIETLVDFYDDLLFAKCALTPADIDSLFSFWASQGIQSVTWYYQADDRGGLIHRRCPVPGAPGHDAFEIYRNCNVMQEAARCAHAHGIRFIAGYKPYETGFYGMDVATARQQDIRTVMQAGRMITGIDPFVVEHPELRLKLKPSLRAASPNPRIGKIELWKADDAPTRIKAENLEFLFSDENCRYQVQEIPFGFHQEIRMAPADGFDLYGNQIFQAGRPVRVLCLTGMDFQSPDWALRCRNLEGEGDFTGLGTRMMRVFDVEGRQLNGCFAGKRTICDAGANDLETHGAYFDIGWGRFSQTFDAPGEYIAFLAEKPEYVTGALCETSPEVQEFWLRNVRAMLDAGADGIEFRIENHSCMTDDAAAYGFNEVVLAACGENASDDAVAKVRGDAYTHFLHKASEMIHKAGKITRLNLSVDGLAKRVPEDRLLAFPQNVEYQWERWLAEGYADEAVLRVYNAANRKNALKLALTDRIAEQCRRHQVPLYFSHHVFPHFQEQGKMSGDSWCVEEAKRIAADRRFAGLSLYENSIFVRCNAGHCWEWLPKAEELLQEMVRLQG